jgi:hypothetical protein
MHDWFTPDQAQWVAYRACNPNQPEGNVEDYGGTYVARTRKDAEYYISFWGQRHQEAYDYFQDEMAKAKLETPRQVVEVYVPNAKAFHLTNDKAWALAEAIYGEFGDDEVLEAYQAYTEEPIYMFGPEEVAMVKSWGYNIITYVGKFDDDEGGHQDVAVILEGNPVFFNVG